MEIQRTSAVNFGATKILSASAGKETIDIFKLNPHNKNDINFIRTCKMALINRKDSGRTNIALFVSSFLNKCKDFNDFYLGIKNGECISVLSNPAVNPKTKKVLVPDTYINNYANNSSQFSKDCLVYSILANSQKSYKNHDIINLSQQNNLFNSYSADNIYGWKGFYYDNIENVKKQIEARYPDATFQEGENQETNLHDFLGIKQQIVHY